MPPQQLAEWTAPKTQLPASLVSAVTQLFGIGLADPRGCEYRQVEIAVGDVWQGGGDAMKTHAWVLPGTTPVAAVAWNGLVYPTRSVGEPADLATDVRGLLDADAKTRAQWAGDHPGVVYHRSWAGSTSEAAAISSDWLAPLKVALLLRLGDAASAERVWAASADPDDRADAFQTLATSWLWARYDRAVTAHMRGDDELSLESARPLPELGRLAEGLGKARGVPIPSGLETRAFPHFAFLDGVELLIADEARRVAAPRPALDVAPLAGIEPSKRVAALIDALDQVAERQWGQPGAVDLAGSPIVAALVSQGDAAVEPLLDVLERDTRLTRSVHFGRDFAMSRSLLGVHEAAYVALASLLDTSAFESASTGDDLSGRGMDGRRDVAKRLRAFYVQWRGVPAEERWYRTLADDAAKPEAWLDAAARITQPSNVVVHPSASVFQSTLASPVAPGQTVTLRGEPLRSKTPTVADLLALRTEATASNTRMACQMAQALVAWDAAAGLPTLGRQVERAVQASALTPGKHEFGACIVALTLARAEAHDAGALTDYEHWIASTSSQGQLLEVRGYFEPMWRYAKDPAMIRASRAAFGAGGGWLPLVPTQKVTGTSFPWTKQDLLRSDLLGVAAFRNAVLAALADRRKAGVMRVQSTSTDLDMVGGWSTGQAIDDKDPLAPPVGTVHDVRVCDVVAAELSLRDGAPRFRHYWPLAERDAALAKTLAFVRALP